MEQEVASFLAREYQNFWKDYGVADAETLESRIRLRGPARKRAPSPLLRTPAPASLEAIREALGDCQRCPLCRERKRIVFGQGNPQADLVFVGEGPGAEEDEQGLAFVGRAGQLLTKIIEAMGYRREEVYIANVVKCRPPENRAPLPEEIAECLPYLQAQLDTVNPRVLVALGGTAVTALTGKSGAISSLRGKFQRLPQPPNLWMMPTYHPAYLLRNPEAKKLVWEDMKQVKAKLEARA